MQVLNGKLPQKSKSMKLLQVKHEKGQAKREQRLIQGLVSGNSSSKGINMQNGLPGRGGGGNGNIMNPIKNSETL